MTLGMDYPDGATPLDPDEMEGLRFKHISTRGELDQLEQASITEGMKWLGKQKAPNVLTERFVCDLHKRLFGDVWKWAGSFRKTEKNIGGRYHLNRALYTYTVGKSPFRAARARLVYRTAVYDARCGRAGGTPLVGLRGGGAVG